MVIGGDRKCGVYPIYASEQKGLELEFGDSSRDIAELEPDNSNDIHELQVKGSNHNNQDDQTKKIEEVVHQTITTGLKHVKVESNENSCHDFVGMKLEQFNHSLFIAPYFCFILMINS